MRLGLRYVARLRREAGERIAAERARRPFDSIADVAQRAGLERWELERLAEAGALGAFGATRRQALWQAAAVERDPESLLARADGRGDGSSSALRTSPLPEMSPCEETVADYRAMGLTAGRTSSPTSAHRLRALGWWRRGSFLASQRGAGWRWQGT